MTNPTQFEATVTTATIGNIEIIRCMCGTNQCDCGNQYSKHVDYCPAGGRPAAKYLNSKEKR